MISKDNLTLINACLLILSCITIYLVFNVNYKNPVNRNIFVQINNTRHAKIYKTEELNYLKIEKIIRYECLNSPCGGWADRLKGIVNGYVWSILTDRKFEINIKYPCQFHEVLAENNINWYKNESDLLKEKNNNYSYFRVKAFQDHKLRKEMQNIDLHEYGKDENVIVLLANLDWLLYLSQNTKVRDKIVSLGYEIEEFRLPYLFQTIYNRLFKLQPHLEIKYKNLLKTAKPTNDSKLVCIQYRVGYSKRENTKVFFDFVNTTFIRNMKTSDYKVFITTDVKEVELEAIKYFGNENSVKIDGEISHIDYEQFENNCTKIEKVILDFHFLQNCDMAVISNSGFGKLGLWNRNSPDKDLYIFKLINDYKYEFSKMDLRDEAIIL